MAPYNKAPLPAPVFGWTGFYVGADVGGVWSSEDVSSACGGCGQAPAAGSFSANGFIGGLYSGYNWQVAPQWVVGVEGDWSWAKLGGSASAPNLFPRGAPVGSGGVSWSRTVKRMASLRGRLGWTATSTMLLYATGGAALSGTDYAGIDEFSGGCPNCSAIRSKIIGGQYLDPVPCRPRLRLLGRRFAKASYTAATSSSSAKT
jgi:outer membrane immunogenic protein